ncbi:MAG: hypothetical protein J5580_01600 [Clostridia bacterium]|nr:hypothetical protein [Clostridia bacterium]
MEKLKNQTINRDEAQIKLLARMFYDYVVGPNAKEKNNFVADKVTEARLQEVQDICKKAYAHLGEYNSHVPLPTAIAWYRATESKIGNNGKVVEGTMFPAAITNKETGRLEAFIAMTPLKPDSYNKFKKGELLDVDLDAKDMMPFQKGKNQCLVMDVASMNSKLSRPAAATLLYAFLKQMNALEKAGVEVDSIIVDVCTEMGFNSANLVLDMKQARGTKYDVAAEDAALYEGKIKPTLLQQIEQEIEVLKAKNAQKQMPDDRTM